MAKADESILMTSWSELKHHLDSLDHAARLEWVYALPRGKMAELYERSANRPMSLEDFVPNSVEDGVEVIHWGKNGIPIFKTLNRFQKRFTRTAQSSSVSTLIGYNESKMRFFVGPGSMVCHVHTDADSVTHPVVDYTREVTEAVDGWPAPKPAGDRLGFFVYRGLQDWMWPVSDPVSIGRCYKGGKWNSEYFVLTREDRG